MKYTEKQIQIIITNIHNWYDNEHPKLMSYAKQTDNGGQFIEKFLQNIFDEK